MVGTALVPTVVMVITGITISNFFEERSFESPLDQAHPLVYHKTLTLAVWIIARDDYAIQAFHSKLPQLSQAREELGSLPNYQLFWKKCLAGLLNGKLTHFKVL